MACSIRATHRPAQTGSRPEKMVLSSVRALPRCQRPVTASSVASTATTVTMEEKVTPEAPQSTTATASSTVPHLDDQTFYQFLQTNGDNLCVVDYYSDWCGPCQMMNKELDKLVAAFPKRVKFAKMNVGNHPEFGTRQRIRALPTFRLYYKGACVDELTGARPTHLRQMLTHYSLMASIN